MNPYFGKDASRNSSIDMSQVQKSYDQSLSNNYRAILGSTSTRELIIRNLARFLMTARSNIAPDILQQHFTSFGYFNTTSRAGINEYCQSRSKYIGAVFVFPITSLEAASPCGKNSTVAAILLAYSPRGFFVPSSNHFADSITLANLARAMQKPGGALWSDLNKDWPQRRIRWVFSAQEDFVTEFGSLGIKPPDRFQLSASYDSAFLNLSDHPDNLLLAPINTGLNANLQGARFRMVSVKKTDGIMSDASADLVKAYPPKLLKGVYIFYDKDLPQHCIMSSFAAYLVKNNKIIMAEDGLIPLPSDQQKSVLAALEKELLQFNSTQPALTLCKAYSEFLKSGAEPEPKSPSL